MSIYNEVLTLVKSLGKEGILKAMPHLSASNKRVLASVLNELQLKKSLDVTAYNPNTEEVPVVSLEVETYNPTAKEEGAEEDLLVNGSEAHGSQGDKTPPELVANVAKSVSWFGKNLFSTTGKFHINSESFLFAEKAEPIEKSDSDLSNLESLIIKGEDRSWVDVQKEKALQKLQEVELRKATPSYSEEDLLQALKISKEDAAQLIKD